jgi:peptidoglycan hydrolase-like protein with peptidoglycan-binding domain
MTRYAKRPDKRKRRGGWLRAGLSGMASAAARNPVAVAGTTAFMVSLAFVSANALFYQPQVHPSAFVSTRALSSRPMPAALPQPQPRPEAAEMEVREAPAESEHAATAPEPESTGSVPHPRGDATVRAVQKVLSDLSLYQGTIDGMVGPQTNAAIETYRRIVGLEPGTAIDSALMRQLGLEQGTAADTRPTTPAQEDESGSVQTASIGEGASLVRRVQAGLRAFGHESIEPDGVMGERTREAIREFQSLFGLAETGEMDQEFIAKMREVGLIN